MNMTVDTSCSGIGCCQTPFPQSIKKLGIFIGSIRNHTKFLDLNQCGYAFVSDKNSFNASDFKLSGYSAVDVKPEVVVECVVKEETYEEAQENRTGYACGSNTDCTFSEHDNGYRCLSKEGVKENPYLQQGCQGKNSMLMLLQSHPNTSLLLCFL